MGNNTDTKELLRTTFFKMFKKDVLSNLDMDDFVVMWQALADKWGIYLTDKQWDDFAEEINSVASNRQFYFNEIFDKHFKN